MTSRPGAGGLAFALDLPDLGAAEAAAAEVGDAVDMLKVGLELFVLAGPLAVRLGEKTARPVFLDLKLHDIPETVERAVAQASGLGVKLLTVHASGGPKMLERAVDRAAKEATGMTVVAVTVLTSFDEPDLLKTGVSGAVDDQVLRLAKLGWSAGVRAFVCSPNEVARMRRELGPEAILVTPGIRSGAAHGGDDQKRIATAGQAIRDGASWLVVGRPIRDAQAPDGRRGAAEAIQREIADARRAKD